MMCEDEALVQSTIRPLTGQTVSLAASAEGVTIQAADAASVAVATNGAAPAASNGNGTAAKPSATRPGAITKASAVGMFDHSAVCWSQRTTDGAAA